MSKWTHSAGTKPHTVTVFEREPGGVLFARVWDSSARDGKGNWRLKSLGHRDKQKAKRYAVEQAAKLQQGVAAIAEGKFTLAQVFALYLRHKTPDKSAGQQKADEQRVELWTRVLGANMNPHDVTPEQWATHIRNRTAGVIDARGKLVPEKDENGKPKRKAVRARTVEIECDWLRFCFNWATEWRLSSGQYLMRYNPIRGNAFDVPREKNPRQPLADEEYVSALRSAAAEHTMEIRTKKAGSRGFKPEKVRSYLADLIELAEGTGRRISAICQLRYSDLQLKATKDAPYGAIRWPGETDKEGKEWNSPIVPEVRAVLKRIVKERPALGPGYLFPAPGNPAEAITKRLATTWLHEAEKAAKIAHVPGRGWHSFRRTWATARKHRPDVDVAAAGGWKSLAALKRYQKTDAASVLAVVLGTKRAAK